MAEENSGKSSREEIPPCKTHFFSLISNFKGRKNLLVYIEAAEGDCDGEELKRVQRVPWTPLCIAGEIVERFQENAENVKFLNSPTGSLCNLMWKSFLTCSLSLWEEEEAFGYGGSREREREREREMFVVIACRYWGE